MKRWWTALLHSEDRAFDRARVQVFCGLESGSWGIAMIIAPVVPLVFLV